MALADRVTVMRAGPRRGRRRRRATSPSSQLAELMVGRADRRSAARARAPPRPRAVLEARELACTTTRGLPRGARRLARRCARGEIVGIAGVEGNGQRELVECLAGLRAPRRGDGARGRRATSRGARRARAPRAGPRAHSRRSAARAASSPTMTLRREPGARPPARARARRAARWLDRPRARRARHACCSREYDVRPPDPRARAAPAVGRQPAEAGRRRASCRAARARWSPRTRRAASTSGAIERDPRRLLAERDAGRARAAGVVASWPRSSRSATASS